MIVEGVVVNGRVEAKAPNSWPEGSVVTVALAEPEETEEEFLESLRQELADIDAGVPGIPLEVAFAQIAADLKLPPVPRESP